MLVCEGVDAPGMYLQLLIKDRTIADKVATMKTKQTDSLFRGPVRAKVDNKGGFVIPSEFCSALGLKVGDEIVMSSKDGELCITKAPQRKTGSRGRARR